MTDHLLLITLGPVQDFIAQARRTRDLWYGSHLLSEISRCIARSLVEQGVSLVFPALAAGDPELNPCLAPLRPETRKPPVNVANKILAVVPTHLDPKRAAQVARESAKRFWIETIAAPVQQAQAGLLAPDIDRAWNEQVATLLEFTAAWAPLGAYHDARRQVEQAVAARKNLRDFRPWVHLRGDVPKSNLDGARETVLRPPKERDRGLVRRFRIGDGEQLDAIGLIKRTGGDPDQFVPIVNVALASWLDLAAREASQQLADLRRACADLGLARVSRPDLPGARPFGFDASILLPSRWKAVFEEQGLRGDPESWGRTHVRPLLAKLSDPFPYVACLVADGDGMGRAIDALATVDAHRTFSKALAGFAAEARRIVEQEHQGSLVYAGGDDVLAFLPVTQAIACADALRRKFGEAMREACAALPERERPTLSVGLGLGHVMEGMGDLLDLGREAERLAKGSAFRAAGRDRNALAVIVDKRSGGRRTWRARWDDWDGNPVQRLRRDIAVMDEELSSRKVYEVARTLRRLPNPADARGDGWARVLALEVRRSLSRVHAGEGGIDPGKLDLRLDTDVEYSWLHAHVTAWIDRMLIARTLSSATPRLRNARREKAA